MLEVNFREWRFYAVRRIEDKRAPKCPVMQMKQACCPSAGYLGLPLNLRWSSRSIAWLRRRSLVPASTYDSPGTPLQRACNLSGCRCARSCGGAAGAFCQTRLTTSSFVVLRGPTTVAGPPAYRLGHLLWLAHRVPAQPLRGAQCGVTIRGG
jgi:hypothetical protein